MKKTGLLLFSGILLLLSGLAIAEDNVNNKLDTLIKYQQTMYKEQKNNPLENKTFGIEINPFRLLFLSERFTLTGGVSLFGVTRSAEIAFPIYYDRPNNEKFYRELNLDCHFRYFFGNTQNGFYDSAFTRYAHLSGYPDWISTFLDTSSNLGSRESSNRIGVGFGLGYRKFSYKGIYWGTGITVGRYLVGEYKNFYGDIFGLLDLNDYIVDFEFFKFGWAF